jgi:hypothetical protein
VLLGDEFGDGTYPHFNFANNYDFGQGVFALGPTSFVPLAGSRLSQFDGVGADPTSSADDDGNRRTERWEARIPWSNLNVSAITPFLSLHVSGLIVSDGVNGAFGNDRFISGNTLGRGAAGDRDEAGNFGFNMGHLTGLPVRIFIPPPAHKDIVWINEIHYDNEGTDVGEGVEIAGPAGLDLGSYTLYLYEGDGGLPYHTNQLAGIIDDEGCGYGAVWFSYPPESVRNGGELSADPDGVCLVWNGTSVVEFLSYEGTFIAHGGPAAGWTSVHIGDEDIPVPPAGQSLQRFGTNHAGSAFFWKGPAPASPGRLNSGQVIAPCVDGDGDHDGIPDAWELLHGLNPLNTEDAHLDSDGDGMSNLEEYWASTIPTNRLSVFMITEFTRNTPSLLSFDTATDRMYRLLFSTSLLNGTVWSPVSNAAPGTGASMSLIDTNEADYRVYRLEVTPLIPP